MRVQDAEARGRIKIIPDGKGGVHIEGRRADVERIAAAVNKRVVRNARRKRLAP